MNPEETNEIREWVFSLKNEDEIRITGAQLKSAWLRTKEKLTLKEIGAKIDADQGNVSKYLGKFQKNFSPLEKVVYELRGYRALTPDELLQVGNKRKMERLQEGYYVAGTRPFGYVKDGRLLKVDIKRGRIVPRLFLGLKAGRTIAEISKKNNVAETTVLRILRNPIYKGMVRWKGKEYPAKHERLVDPQLWEEVQNLLRNAKGGPAPFGTKRVACHLEKDPSLVPRVQQIFEARQCKTVKELESQFGINEGTLRHLLRNRVYIQLDIVKPEVFEAVQGIGRQVARERRKNEKARTFEAILSLLQHTPYGLSAHEIRKTLSLSYHYIRQCLHVLEGQRAVERSGFKKGERLWKFRAAGGVSSSQHFTP